MSGGRTSRAATVHMAIEFLLSHVGLRLPPQDGGEECPWCGSWDSQQATSQKEALLKKDQAPKPVVP